MGTRINSYNSYYISNLFDKLCTDYRAYLLEQRRLGV